MAVVVTVATAQDLPALQVFGDNLDAQGTEWRSSVTIGPPDLATLRTIHSSMRVLQAIDNTTIRGWMAHRPDGVIKWLVADPTPPARFNEAVFAMLRRILADTGNRPSGVVMNPAHLARLTAMGFDTFPHPKAGTWVIWPEGLN
jgi:hypothetical protein